MSLPLWEECRWWTPQHAQQYALNMQLQQSHATETTAANHDAATIPVTTTESTLLFEDISLEDPLKESQRTVPEDSAEQMQGDEVSPPIFPVDAGINQRLYLHLGAAYKLPCNGALVVGQNEGLNDDQDGNDAIFILAGPALEHDLQSLAPIQTGESVLTPGYTLPCEYLIHAVGPKYDDRYLTAADHALFSAYKSSLLLAAGQNGSTNGCKDLIISCIYKQNKRYPRFEAAHVALRTVRKFLEHSIGDVFERIMFCVPSQEDYEIYSTLMTAYFPRDDGDIAGQFNLLPGVEALGDEWGERRIAERVLKVSAGPQPLPREVHEQYKQRSSSVGDEILTASGKYASKTGSGRVNDGNARRLSDSAPDPDVARARKIQQEFSNMTREERLKLRFQFMATEMKSGELDEELAEYERHSIAQIIGKDNKGRAVVFMSASKLKLLENRDVEHIIMAIMRVMEELRCVPFTLIYGVAGMNESNHPSPEFTQSVFDLFTCRYKENMHRLIILHATFIFRMYFFFALPFLATPFWRNYVNCDSIKNLQRYMDVSKLNFPEDVKRYDRDHYK